ncbi:MAG: sulfatase [Myxococcota bacterium]|nr:sulfatase [Myxococcota bacterium]
MWKRLFDSRWFYWVALALMLVLFTLSQVRFGTNPRPMATPEAIAGLSEIEDLNIVFILIDTLRADRLGAYGHERATSPAIDALAADGLRFARNMSQSSWTKCSMASMWTAHYPVRTGVTRSEDAISSDAQMPAEILREAGYETYALWRNAWVGPSFGFSQGFEVYHSPRPSPIPPSIRREKPTTGVAGTDQDIIHSAREFFRTHGEKRFFLYLHLMDVHQYVYDEASALFGTTYSDIYDNSIHWEDRLVGSLVADLDRRGLREKTLIVLASDHGEAFGEHGREGHARDVYSEVVTTPLIISFPFRLAEPLVVDAVSENVDLWPTLLDLLGLPPIEGANGRSLVPEIQASIAGEELESAPRYAHIDQSWGRKDEDPQPMVAVTEGPYRLIYREAGRGPRRAELYAYASDRQESRRIDNEEPEVRERMIGLAQAYLESEAPAWGDAPEIELNDAQLQQLRALGYEVE